MSAQAADPGIAALRAQIDALTAQALSLRALAEAVLGEGAAAVSGDCPHPKEQRRPAGVMGAPNQFLCGACRQLVSGDAPVAEEASA